MRILLATTALALGLAACGYVSEYEAQVYDMEPVYCYRTLGAVQCRAEPDRESDRRLVNYYGPAPSRTDPPEKPEYALPDPPPDVNYWVKDAEPLPRPAPTGDLSDRPWLQNKSSAVRAPEGKVRDASATQLIPVVLNTPTESF